MKCWIALSFWSFVNLKPWLFLSAASRDAGVPAGNYSKLNFPFKL